MYTRKRIFEIIQVGSDSDHESRLFDYVLAAAILLNLFIALYSTFEGSARYEKVMFFTELLTVIFFTQEFILRLWTADFLYPEKGSRSAAADAVFRFSQVPRQALHLHEIILIAGEILRPHDALEIEARIAVFLFGHAAALAQRGGQ